MIQQQKTRQEQRRSDEEQTGQPQGAKSEIDEDSLARRGKQLSPRSTPSTGTTRKPSKPSTRGTNSSASTR